ncbi:MAG TPA: hypothetical protein PLP41_06090 [Treponemataceae bacterium]|nr:hypothetical protein [Treponemataceae bacterium]HOS34575.1 hypothetical protein [Treponemataceae bacterium]HPL91647.1 hypothetical protein [Treponemataceae bacterium]HRR01398.1 hypothetical protein [Treponemataceae bacterium]
MNTFSNLFRSLIAGLFLVCGSLVGAQTLVAGHSLRVIATDHFDIIFPEESRPGAEYLAGIAEKHLEDITTLLGIPFDERIPVTLTPFTDQFNGYMSSFPYSHIVLYDAPPDVEFVAYRNSLESLFVHELVHVVSLATRSSFFKKLNRLFGGWVMPAALSAPMFMVEGVTVSFESRSGFGRANDPLVHHRLSQAAYEGTFLSPVQASDTWDHPPFARAYYEYGGMFSAWLQKKYGMPRYAKLWQELGTTPRISLWYTRSGFYAAFERVYQMPLLEAWSDFAASFKIPGIIDNDDGMLTGDDCMILSVAAGTDRVFFLDRYTRRVYALDPETGRSETVLKVDSESETIALSPDGTRLLVSGFRTRGSLVDAEVREYDVQTGKKTGRIWRDSTAAAYFRDGIVSLSHDRHASRLVYYEDPDTPRVLLSGSPELLFSNPVPLDSSRIVFIAAERGIRSLWIYDAETESVSIVSAGEYLDSHLWSHIRGLSAGPDELLFSYHDGEGLYKLARIELGKDGQGELILDRTNYSGGVFSPVRCGTRVVYRAQFSGTDALAGYPEADSGEMVERYPLSFVSRTVGPADGEAAVSDSRDAPVSRDTPDSSDAPAFPVRFEEKDYSPCSWLNPLDLWFPVPLIRSTGSTLRLDGGGIVTYMGTPTDMNVFLLFAAYDARENFGEVDATWVSFVPGAPLTVRMTDGIEFFTNDSFRYPYRETRGSAALSFVRGIGGERIRYAIEPSFEAVWAALPRPGAASAYEWPYEDGLFIPGLSLSLMNRDRLPRELFGRGVSLTVSGKAALPENEFRYDAVFRASAGTAFPVRMTLYGARDESGMDIDGSSFAFNTVPWASAAAVEYADDDTGYHQWIAGGEAEFCFFSAEIQKPLSHVYWNRFFGILAWRGAVHDSDDADAAGEPPGTPIAPGIRFVNSLVLKAGAVVTLLPVPMLPVRLSPHGWVAWKLADGEPLNLEKSLVFGLSFQIEW